MGSAESRQINYFLEAIICGRDGAVARQLKAHPNLVNCDFYGGVTNPLCRATYLGHRNIVALLFKYGADVNKRSQDQRTPLIWAAFRDNTQMMEILMEQGADLNAVDKDGWNALDIAIIRINFQAAKVLTKAGLRRRSIEEYEGKTWRKYDIKMMFEGIDADTADIPYKDFFILIKKQREEWLAQDLVVDRRETYRSYIWR